MINDGDVIGINNQRVPNGKEYFATVLTEDILVTFIHPTLVKFRMKYGLLTKEELVLDQLLGSFNEIFRIRPDRSSKLKPATKALNRWLELGPLDAKKLVYSNKLWLQQDYNASGPKLLPIALEVQTNLGLCSGQINAKTQPDGIGRRITRNGDIQEGQLTNNLTNEGFIRHIFHDGAYFIGSHNGYGKLYN